MKTKYLYLLLPILLAGCSKDCEPAKDNSAGSVTLSVGSLYGSKTRTRTAVDEWDETTIGLAYRVDPETSYTKCVNAVVDKEQDQVIDMGMEYPADGKLVYVRGYYPAQELQASGIVTYDVSKGDVDVMCSNEVSGDKDNTIISQPGTKLQFKHMMTRLTFNLVCANGQTYPERIAGILIGGVKTRASINLATPGAAAPIFTVPGIIFTGQTEGYVVPPDYAPADQQLTLETIVQPNTPLTIEVITVNDNVKPVTIPSTSGVYVLTTTGGEAGRQYIINLTFSGTTILADKMTVEQWKDGVSMPSQPTGTNPWW